MTLQMIIQRIDFRKVLGDTLIIERVVANLY
jgi:hypothetical protein